ncbi:superinfection exclusion B family protein [Proteus mirabilis]
MPNWIEAVFTYLKKQTSLRFIMFWFLSWMAILLFIPSGWAEFIDNGIGKWNVPYIGTAIFMVPVSFFISLVAKNLYESSLSFLEKTKEKKQLTRAIKVLNGLTEKEMEIVNYIFQNGSSEYIANCPISDIFKLVNKGVIHGIGYDSPLSRTYYLEGLYEEAMIKIIAKNN